MESFFESLARDNNRVTIQKYLTNSIPTSFELSRSIEITTDEVIKNILLVYDNLLNMDLRDYLNLDYHQRKVNNLMVI